MGGSSSQPSPPPPCPLTCRPWREPSDWSQTLEQTLIADIKRLNPEEKPSVLLVGPVGAGKSSFINAALSIGIGYKVENAQAGSSVKSYTTSFDKYSDKSLLKKFNLRDCMGIEPQENEGFHVDDMVMLLKGHIKDTYSFNPRSPIAPSDSKYRANPEFKHQTHCVVFVVDAKAVHNGIPKNYVSKIATLQERIKALRIPRVLILTKVDLLCAEVERDIKNLFRSVKVQNAVKTAAEVFRIPESSIHPVKNYAVDIELSTNTNIPILLALRQTLQYADQRVQTVLNHSDSD